MNGSLPKAYFDENNVLNFRSDLSSEEIDELDALLTDAFNCGLRSGYRQGYAKAQNAAVAS